MTATLADYATARPPGPLGEMVTRYIGYREHAAEPFVRREVPHPAVTLILSFGDTISVDGRPQVSFAAGLHDRPVLTEFRGDQHGIEVILDPLAAYRLFGLPQRHLANAVLPAADLLPAALVDRLAEAPDWTARFALLTGVLTRGLTAAPDVPAEVRFAWQRLRASGGTVPIGALADETGWSRRHLAARFTEYIGLAPKAAARVLRFDLAARTLRARHGAAGRPDLARLAHDRGYYDQAHLTREFRDLAGVTPAAYAAAASPLV